MTTQTYRLTINLCIAVIAAGVLISNRFGDSMLLPKIFILGAGLTALAAHIVAKRKTLGDEGEDRQSRDVAVVDEEKADHAKANEHTTVRTEAWADGDHFYLAAANNYQMKALIHRNKHQLFIADAVPLTCQNLMTLSQQEEILPAWKAAIEISKALAVAQTRYEVKLTSDNTIRIMPVEADSIERFPDRKQETPEQTSFLNNMSELVH